MVNCLPHPTPFLFFPGKGGGGQTPSALAPALQPARAGKQGKGFAGVADQVGKPADKRAKRAKEIA